MADIQTKSDIDSVLERQIRAARESFAANAAAMRSGGQVEWMRPDGSPGDLLDWEEIGRAFNRNESNGAFVAATSDPDNSGTVGDLIITTTQVDYLANMETAYRMRHTMDKTRCMLHTVGLDAGNGDPQGALTVCVLEYLRNVVKQTKGQKT